MCDAWLAHGGHRMHRALCATSTELEVSSVLLKDDERTEKEEERAAAVESEFKLRQANNGTPR